MSFFQTVKQFCTCASEFSAALVSRLLHGFDRAWEQATSLFLVLEKKNKNYRKQKINFLHSAIFVSECVNRYPLTRDAYCHPGFVGGGSAA